MRTVVARAVVEQPHQVDHDLPVAPQRLDLPILLEPVADHDHLRVRDDVTHRRPHQRPDVRDLALDVGPVRPYHCGSRYIGIVDRQLQALPEQCLSKRDQRSFPEVVGPRLEAEAQDPHPPLSCL